MNRFDVVKSPTTRSGEPILMGISGIYFSPPLLVYNLKFTCENINFYPFAIILAFSIDFDSCYSHPHQLHQACVCSFWKKWKQKMRELVVKTTKCEMYDDRNDWNYSQMISLSISNVVQLTKVLLWRCWWMFPQVNLIMAYEFQQK